jgi:hypothetical protein
VPRSVVTFTALGALSVICSLIWWLLVKRRDWPRFSYWWNAFGMEFCMVTWVLLAGFVALIAILQRV